MTNTKSCFNKITLAEASILVLNLLPSFQYLKLGLLCMFLFIIIYATQVKIVLIIVTTFPKDMILEYIIESPL